MNVAAFPNDSGSRYWRLEHPFKYLARRGIDAVVCETGITEEVADWADAYVLQGCVDKAGIALLHACQQEFGKKLIVDCDDRLEVEPDNPHKREHEVSDALTVIKATIAVADLVTTTTAFLKHQLQPLAKRVVVLPNMLDLEVWDKPPLPKIDGRVRVGWAGSITHLEDLFLVRHPLLRLLDAYPRVQLVFVGDPRIKELFPPDRCEVMMGVPFPAWPDRLRGLRLDVGLAPLRDTPFNRAKSTIKWLEYAINRIPGVYSPTVYGVGYQGRNFDGKLGMIAETEEEWERSIENLILHEALRQDIADHAYATVRREYDLSTHVPAWQQAYEALFR